VEKTHYDILGLEPNATPDKIRRAYRSLARRYHPDGNTSEASEILFRKLNEAYSVLSSEERRRKYNETLGLNDQGERTSNERRRSSVKQPFDSQPFEHSDKDIDEVREKFNGPTSARTRIEPEEPSEDSSVFKKFTKIFNRTEEAKEGKEPKPKEDTGTFDIRGERVYHFSIDALESLTGTSREIALKTVDSPRVIKVRIPAGVSSDDLLKVKVSHDGEEKAIQIRVSVTPHEFIERDGKNIIYKVPITFAESLEGVELEVPTLKEPVKFKVPARWDVNKRLRARGKGVGSDPGDLLIQLVIVPPDSEPFGASEITEALRTAYTRDLRTDFPKKLKN